VKYAHENGCPWGEETCLAAVEGGHLEVLQYLHENGCPWDLGRRGEFGGEFHWCNVAARKGHLEVLKYLHENGCPWNESTCRRAAEGSPAVDGGNLEVLKYLHENGCPWDAYTFKHALEQNDCLWDDKTFAGFSAACEQGQLEMLKYAQESLGFKKLDKFTCSDRARVLGHLEVLKYLHENGCPLPRWAVDE
jgi:hypothetical protein